MKKALVILNICLILTTAAAIAMQYINTPRIAYVKSNILLNKFEGFVHATKAYEEKSKVWQANIDTLKNEFQAYLARFEAEKSSMTAKERELNEELIKNKQKQLVQYQQGIQQKAQEEDQAMTQKVLNEVNSFLSDYGKRHNYTIIFGATEVGNIVYADEAKDITEDVLKELNQKYEN